jgi:transcriptional/translational regulatory protein YebC/TACO1
MYNIKPGQRFTVEGKQYEYMSYDRYARDGRHFIIKDITENVFMTVTQDWFNKVA